MADDSSQIAFKEIALVAAGFSGRRPGWQPVPLEKKLPARPGPIELTPGLAS
jgi:hypothetical protein